MPRPLSFNHPLMLGFDRFEQMLDQLSKTSGDGYPPYNIEQMGDNRLRITLAVAGFTENDLQITLEQSQLIIHGKQRDETDRVFLHRGIAARQFQRKFVLAEGLEVAGAEIENGLLHIDLELPTPKVESRQIAINRKNSKKEMKTVNPSEFID
ncbi:MAG: heat-shock protein Hsp20 [Sneathiella sp.]|jgi:HSP20 family molecular chaperone IbpA|uniref:Hsp20 family protein n=1 Tax=Sneathiella sp. TaxID=1964365 RepID=UPI000C4110B0|nr:Hsp20 family protein [Sneathiella sp.]MAL79053.1 heat-shock protein Hsp20 [Sneathiella sp.]